MLTLKQTPVALFGILFACGLTEGDPNRGKLITALCIVIATILYVLICNKSNSIKNEKRKTGMYR